MKVVISYSTKNLTWVDKIKTALASEDVEVFVAEYDVKPGRNLNAEIETAVEDCDLLIVLWSKEARESNFVRHEVSLAKGKKKHIIPVVLDDDRNLPEFIKGLKYVDLKKNPDGALADLKKIVGEKANAQTRKMFGVLLTIVGVLVAVA